MIVKYKFTPNVFSRFSNTKECFKESCSYWHIKGTIRSKENENQENKSTEKLHDKNPPQSSPLLAHLLLTGVFCSRQGLGRQGDLLDDS